MFVLVATQTLILSVSAFDFPFKNVRIASRLATVGEGNPFRALDPADKEVTPETTTVPVPQNRFQIVFPQDLNHRIWMYTDGQLAAGTNPVDTRYYPDYSYQARKNGIMGGAQGQLSPSRENALWYSTENFSVTDNVKTLDANWPFLKGKSKADTDNISVWVATNTNMAVEDYYEFIQDSSIYGLLRPYTKRMTFTYTEWMLLKFSLTKNDFFDNYSVTYNETEIKFATYYAPLVTNSGFHCYIHEWVKVITSRGTIVFMLCYNEQFYEQTPFTRQEALTYAGFFETAKVTNNEQLVSNMPLYPILNVDEQLGAVSKTINTLPMGNLLFRMTEMPPSSVAVGQAQMPTCTDNAVIAKYFKQHAAGLTTLECLQFRLIDAQSVRPIATVRYLQEAHLFVINAPNAPTRYRVIPQNNQNIIIGQISVVQRATDFQETPVFEWVDRVAPEFTRRGDFFHSPINYNFKDITPTQTGYTANAFLATLAGGALGGIGQAIGEHQNRQQQLKM